MVLVEKYPNSEFSWFAFSRICIKYRGLLCNTPYQSKCGKNEPEKFRIHTLLTQCQIWKRLLIKIYILVQIILLLTDQFFKYTSIQNWNWNNIYRSLVEYQLHHFAISIKIVTVQQYFLHKYKIIKLLQKRLDALFGDTF